MIVTKLDRFARPITDGIITIKELFEKGIKGKQRDLYIGSIKKVDTQYSEFIMRAIPRFVLFPIEELFKRGFNFLRWHKDTFSI